MRPSTSIQQIISGAVDSQVFSTVPEKVPGEFITHHIVSSKPVANGPVTVSESCVVSVSVIAASNNRAYELSRQVLQALSDTYESGTGDLAYFGVDLLPTRQGSVGVVTSQGSTQYDAVYRMIFTV